MFADDLPWLVWKGRFDFLVDSNEFIVTGGRMIFNVLYLYSPIILVLAELIYSSQLDLYPKNCSPARSLVNYALVRTTIPL